MQAAKVDVLVAFFCYGGNGGVAMQLPEIGQWWATTFAKMSQDPRIGRVACQKFADTPVTMTRNQAVEVSKQQGFDLLLMIDSDNELDICPDGKPFWDTSFEFAYNRLVAGLPTVIFAPYCGPPPHPKHGGEENVYVFKWLNRESDVEYPGIRLVAYDRDEAARMTGIQPAGAGPTGAILYTVNAFELQAPPHFYYEWVDASQSRKASTEDVTNTRDIALSGWIKYRQDVVFCNWDAWAGHHKPKCVGKPIVLTGKDVGRAFADAVRKHPAEEVREIDFTHGEDAPPLDGQAINEEPPAPLRQVSVSRSVNGHRIDTIGDPAPEELLELLSGVVSAIRKRSPGPMRILQVGGCWVGQETLALLRGCDGKGTVFCLDEWESAYSWGIEPETVREKFKKNIGRKLGKQVKILDELPRDPQGVDVVVWTVPLDADEDFCSQSIASLLRHVAPHGALLGLGAGHGVMTALRDTAHRYMPEVGAWLLERRDHGPDRPGHSTDLAEGTAQPDG